MITDYTFKMNEYLTKWDFPDESEPSSSNKGMNGMNFSQDTFCTISSDSDSISK